MSEREKNGTRINFEGDAMAVNGEEIHAQQLTVELRSIIIKKIEEE